MRATLLLADAAQVAEGKLYILGAGWSITGPQPTPMAVAVIFQVAWNETNQKHFWALDLVDDDGGQVRFGPEEGNVVHIEGEFETGRPAGLKEGTDIDVPLAMNIAPMPLAPDSRYAWRLSLLGDADSTWSAAFTTRPLSTSPSGGYTSM